MNKGIFDSERFINQGLLSNLERSSQSYIESQLDYYAGMLADFQIVEIHCTDPRVYASKLKLHDPDTHTYHEALTRNHYHEYEAMKIDMRQLINQSDWRPIRRSLVPPTPDINKRPIIKETCAFKIKRLPDGSPSKFKSRYCVRGNLQ